MGRRADERRCSLIRRQADSYLGLIHGCSAGGRGRCTRAAWLIGRVPMNSRAEERHCSLVQGKADGYLGLIDGCFPRGRCTRVVS